MKSFFSFLLGLLLSFFLASGMIFAAGVWPSSPIGEQDGGDLSFYLRKILNTPSLSVYVGDGTVKNTDKLNNLDGSDFQIKFGADCALGTYLTSILADGTLVCGGIKPSAPPGGDCGCLEGYGDSCTYTPATHCCGGGGNGASCTMNTVGACGSKIATCVNGSWMIN